MTVCAQLYPQAWPLCWLQMKWDLVLCTARKTPQHRLLVVWAESALQQQVSPSEFRATVDELREALTLQWGDRLVWRIDTSAQAQAHRIEMIKEPKT